MVKNLNDYKNINISSKNISDIMKMKKCSDWNECSPLFWFLQVSLVSLHFWGSFGCYFVSHSYFIMDITFTHQRCDICWECHPPVLEVRCFELVQLFS